MSAEKPTYRLADLAFLDSELARRVERELEAPDYTIGVSGRSDLIAEIIWGLSQETAFGHAIAEGLLTLLKEADARRRGQFRQMVRQAGRKGPTLGRVMATYLVPVLCRDDAALLAVFIRAVDCMARKGLYTLKPALECLPELLSESKTASAMAYLELLTAVFASDITYSQSQHFSHALPKAALAFSAPKRPWQLKRLAPLIKVDVHLVKAYLQGMEKGLDLLSEKALECFVGEGLAKYRREPIQGCRFMALASKAGRDFFSELQVAVSLAQVEPQLHRYLQARTGTSIPIKPLSQLPAKGRWADCPELTACSDGRSIYLPDRVDLFETRSENQDLYKCLVRFESAYSEFGTFDFDLQRLIDRGSFPALPVEYPRSASDLELFFSAFRVPELAEDLFILFEHRRIHRAMKRRYPGLMRRYLPFLQNEAARLDQNGHGTDLLANVYRHMALEMPAVGDHRAATLIGVIENHLAQLPDIEGVESSAQMVIGCYRAVSEALGLNTDKPVGYRSMRFPLGRRIYPDLVYAGRLQVERLAAKIQAVLESRGVRLYKSLIRRYMQENRSVLSREVVEKMHRNIQHRPDGTTVSTDDLAHWLSGIEGIEHPVDAPLSQPSAGDTDLDVSWYWEWDHDAQDYRPDHVLVRDRIVPAGGGAFYADVLERHYGMVTRIRRAFELLKPEGLKRLRRWVEGDEFDYRALLDHVVDRRAGRTPGDRLYIKRVKQRREVAVLLLVDLSRSTGNQVAGTSRSVLDIEKEAIVLFAEALQVVGDEFAIAGYSGTGRLGVDFFHIKGFQEPMAVGVRDRIGALAPQRNTRMGGAIRHAAGLFTQAEAKVRLVVLLGDGYPNDADYKKAYAFADTYKAIAELRSHQIHVHAITVNLQGAAGTALDTVFGNVRHTLISDVTELPNKLVHIYGTLTRN